MWKKKWTISTVFIAISLADMLFNSNFTPVLSHACVWLYIYCIYTMDETKKTIYTGAQSDHCQEDRCCWLACPSRLCSELIKAADGGQISLDWFDNDDSLSHPDPATRPTVLLLPGLTGTSRESYILHMVQQSRDLGYRWVVLAE